MKHQTTEGFLEKKKLVFYNLEVIDEEKSLKNIHSGTLRRDLIQK